MLYTNRNDFTGKWITSREFGCLEKINMFHRYLDDVKIPKSTYENSHVLFRKRIHLDSTEDVRIIIGADDCFKLYVNGVFVTECFSQSCREILLDKYLVTGENVIAVHTYYQGLINRVFVSGDNCHGLICDILVKGKVVACSDESFIYSYHNGYSSCGIAGYDTQFMEIYDAASTETGFEQPDYDDSKWQNAVYGNQDGCTLYFQYTKDIVFETIKPRVTETEYGYFIDFEKNYVGRLLFEVKGEAGSIVELRYGQELENGRVRYDMRANCSYVGKMILSGGKDELREFDYKAFRYAEILLPPGAMLNVDSVVFQVRHYPFNVPKKKYLNENIQKIYDLCYHTLMYGVQETVMDCPEREKGYYLGDGCYIALTHGKLTGDWFLFKQLVRDALATAEISPTLLTCLNCSLIQEIAEFPLIMVMSVYIYHKLTGDDVFINEVSLKLKKVLDNYGDMYTDGELINRMDKWCVVEWPDNFRDGYDADLRQGVYTSDTHCVINAYYYGALKAYNLLTGDAVYDTEKIRRAFIKTFYDKKGHRFTDREGSNHSSRISNLFSYAFGLCSDNDTREKIRCELEENGLSKVNIFSAFPVLFRMSEEKMDISGLILDGNTWLNMIKENGTTTFETWSKDKKWNTSLFHLTLSCVLFFM